MGCCLRTWGSWCGQGSEAEAEKWGNNTAAVRSGVCQAGRQAGGAVGRGPLAPPNGSELWGLGVQSGETLRARHEQARDGKRAALCVHARAALEALC